MIKGYWSTSQLADFFACSRRAVSARMKRRRIVRATYIVATGEFLYTHDQVEAAMRSPTTQLIA
jgi:hypothetical protein